MLCCPHFRKNNQECKQQACKRDRKRPSCFLRTRVFYNLVTVRARVHLRYNNKTFNSPDVNLLKHSAFFLVEIHPSYVDMITCGPLSQADTVSSILHCFTDPDVIVCRPNPDQMIDTSPQQVRWFITRLLYASLQLLPNSLFPLLRSP